MSKVMRSSNSRNLESGVVVEYKIGVESEVGSGGGPGPVGAGVS
jgi:hypothetical protein